MEKQEPSLKNLQQVDYGHLKEAQHQPIQELARPHIESFNYIIYEGLTKVIQNFVPVEFELPNKDRISLTFQDIVIGSPKVVEKTVNPATINVYPVECRARGATYRGPLQVQIGYSVNGVPCPPLTRVIGNIPIMVKSDLCNLAGLSPKELVEHGEEAEEMGGYFIVNGIERLLRMLVLPRRNFPLCVTRTGWKNRGSFYTEYGISVRCVRPDQTACNMVLHYLSNGTATLFISHQKEMFFIPIMIILKGLMDVNDKYIYTELVKGKEDDSFYKGPLDRINHGVSVAEWVHASLYLLTSNLSVRCIVSMLRRALSEGLMTRKAVLRYIGERFRIKVSCAPWYTDEQVGAFIIKQCVCVHLSSNEDKFNTLVYMTRKLFDFAKGRCASDSGDNPMNQEVLLGGHLYMMVLKEKLEKYLHTMQMLILKFAKSWKGGSENYKLNPDTIGIPCRFVPDMSRPMEYLLASGNLVSRTGLGLMQDTGLTIVADKLNFLRYVSHFRCVHRGAFFATMRTTAVRKLLPEAWGFLCPVHTPDGSPCGLMNHATALCQIQTVTYDLGPLIKLLYTLGVVPLDDATCSVRDSYTVYMDGKIMGYVSDNMAVAVEQKLRYMKVNSLGKVPVTLEICLVRKTEFASQYPGLYLFTTAARMLRPVINLALGKVEMIGTFEQVYMSICIRPEEAYEGVTTHQEVDDCSMLSFLANLTPFSDFNQSPRNMYQCQMGKQTMGTPLHNLRHRSDNKLYKIQTPQSPIVRPVKYDHYQIDNYPVGTNAIVAVVSYTGYDMEDAMVINKSSLERGFGHASVYKSEFIDLVRESGDEKTNPLIFGGDPKSAAVQKGQLDLDGFPPVGTLLTKGCPYYSHFNVQTGAYKVVNYKDIEPAYVEFVRACGNDTGTNSYVKVGIMVRVNRNPLIGDKFASRHGQKGVCSMMYPVEDMPFTESGMTPDIIFNPHGYPSRMTIGMMIESMAGKAAASFGTCYDATPFQFAEDDPAIDHFGKLLVKAGYNYYGTERMYSGVDGRELEADIFMGVVYYQRLRHMVSDKFQVRTTGPIDQLTQQPMKGRKRGGGVRFGEMERDGLISHGASFLLQDRLFNCSDKCMVVVCTKCGSLLSASMERPASANAAVSFEKQRQWSCVLCKSSADMQVVAVPYVFRYLVAELAAMNIRVDLDIKS